MPWKLTSLWNTLGHINVIMVHTFVLRVTEFNLLRVCISTFCAKMIQDSILELFTDDRVFCEEILALPTHSLASNAFSTD